MSSSYPPNDSQNPWSNEPSQPNTHQTYNPYATHTNQTPTEQPYYQTQTPPQYYTPPSNHPTTTTTTTTNPPTTSTSTSTTQNDETPPLLPPRRTATDLALPTGQDRTHQIQVMQSYQAAGRRDEDDFNVEILQREFPGLDGSLIAAIYGDSKSLSATREMLGELEG